MFTRKTFTSHSGLTLDWKIDCDSLTDDDIKCLARVIIEKITFGKVVGIPEGGLRLAEALKMFEQPGNPMVLVVDDVMTTGKSITEEMKKYEKSVGVVIFNRSKTHLPNVLNIFRLHPIFV